MNAEQRYSHLTSIVVAKRTSRLEEDSCCSPTTTVVKGGYTRAHVLFFVVHTDFFLSPVIVQPRRYIVADIGTVSGFNRVSLGRYRLGRRVGLIATKLFSKFGLSSCSKNVLGSGPKTGANRSKSLHWCRSRFFKTGSPKTWIRKVGCLVNQSISGWWKTGDKSVWFFLGGVLGSFAFRLGLVDQKRPIPLFSRFNCLPVGTMS
jgi:hypothetical protein